MVPLMVKGLMLLTFVTCVMISHAAGVAALREMMMGLLEPANCLGEGCHHWRQLLVPSIRSLLFV